MLQFIKESIIDILAEKSKDFLKEKEKQDEFREKVLEYIQFERKKKEFWTDKEEYDFENLVEYIMDKFFEDVNIYLFGEKEQRDNAKKDIINKAIYYSRANSKDSIKNVEKFIIGLLDIFKKSNMDNLTKEQKILCNKIEDIILNVSNTNNALDRNINLLKDGNVKEVEKNINILMDVLGAQHKLYPDYKYEFNKGRLLSIPITKEGLEKYPPVIKLKAKTNIEGINIENNNFDIINYSDRHQLPIEFLFTDAKKYLGDVEDTVQFEAEQFIGKKAMYIPKPFPKAISCSILFGDDLIFDNIMLRTIEILDDETIVVSNIEQIDCGVKICINANPISRKTNFNINLDNPSNKEILKYLYFIKKSHTENFLRVVFKEKELVIGELGKIQYDRGFESIDDEVKFFENIICIEEYFQDRIVVPEEILDIDILRVNYLARLVKGEKIILEWEKFEFNINVTEKLKEEILKLEDDIFDASYLEELKISFWDKEFNIQIINRLERAKHKDLLRIKEKIKVLDTNDKVGICFVPADDIKSFSYHEIYKDDDIEIITNK